MNPNFHKTYVRNYYEPIYEILTICNQTYLLYIHKISQSKITRKISYSENSKLACLKLVLGACNNPSFKREYRRKFWKPMSKTFRRCTYSLCLHFQKILRYETSHNISYSESLEMTCLKQISWLTTSPNFHSVYLESIENQDLKF